MRKSLNTILFLILSILSSSVYANQVDFYPEKDNSWEISSDEKIEKMNKKLDNFYTKTWLNTDLIILWKWDSCYLDNNFDSCIQKKENYSSDLLIVLSMKSDIKDYWDIRTLIKDEFKESVTPLELKKLQDEIIYYFKNEDFSWWITKLLDNLEKLIWNKCDEIWIEKDLCNAPNLAKQYHSYVAEKEAEKKLNAMIKIIYYIIFVVLVVWSYYFMKSFYKKSINNLYKDTKYKITTVWEFEIFEKDKEKIKKKLEWLSKKLKIKLWDLNKNPFSLWKYYKQEKQTFLDIDSEIWKMQKSFLEREQLKEKIEDFKKIDL